MVGCTSQQPDGFLPLRAFKPSSSESADRGRSIIQINTDGENDEEFEGFDDDENMEVFENRDEFFYPENWSEGRKDPLNGLIEHVQFCENTGIKVQVAKNASISDYFNILLIVKILRIWPRKPTDMQSNIFRKIPTLVDVLDLGSGLAQQLLK